ncbi:MAG: hypothetical protein LRY49_09755 [Burkholderiaceae bacterium]|nr:hypothetical protein [Burkholderiaceae bacterium]
MQHIDLAWLHRDTHQPWFEPMLSRLGPALNRVRLHELKWLGQPQDRAAQAIRPDLKSSQVLANAVLELRRFDALLVTVSLDTLVWTRRCLAAMPKAPVVPIIGVLDGLQSGAMNDLLELGMTDFVQPAVCPQEFRARLVNAVCRYPKYMPLREPGAPFGRMPVDPRNPQRADPRHGSEPNPEKLTVSHLVWPTIGFQENKQRVIDLFEKQYLASVLQKAHGNITQAAKLANKDRRSFWELMRRHRLTSDSGA